MILTLVVTLWLSGLIEQRLLKATSFDTNTKAVLAKFVRAVLLVVGVLVALQAIGFDLTLLTVFGGALGVGIGLGLQKLAANYIAGFTILLDRSIRLGDLITVDGRHGVVSRVTSRYVVVTSLDGVEAIVPNETLITTTVLNHSYTTPEIRISIAFQVAYDSDIELALRLMEEAARAEPRVMGAPNRPDGFPRRISATAASISNWASGCAIRENGQLASEKLAQPPHLQGIPRARDFHPLPAPRRASDPGTRRPEAATGASDGRRSTRPPGSPFGACDRTALTPVMAARDPRRVECRASFASPGCSRAKSLYIING